MKTIKIHITIFIMSFLTMALYAQDNKKHELSFSISGGLNSLNYELKQGSRKDQPGGSVGVGYGYSVSKNWSIQSGLEISSYNTKATLTNFTDKNPAFDGEEDFEFRLSVNNYEEKQEVIFFTIPLLAQYKTPIFKKKDFYIAGGLKIGIPIYSKYNIVDANYQTAGYYTDWDMLLENIKQSGFGTFSVSEYKEKLSIKTSYMLSIESGLRWNLSNNTNIYTGIYFDYGLNNICREQDKRLIEYQENSPNDYIYNGILKTSIPKNIHTIGIGLKIRLAFQL